MRAGFLNQGQVCLAGSRIFVERPLLERFTEALVAELTSRTVGDPSDDATFFGPLSSHMHRDKVESYVKLAVEEGGTIACGGKRPDLPAPFNAGAFYMPTVVTVRVVWWHAIGVACGCRLCSNQAVFWMTGPPINQPYVHGGNLWPRRHRARLRYRGAC